MAEDQNVWAEIWNRRLNTFLKEVLGWRQLGDSNNDIPCPNVEKKPGVDSVFAYKRNLECHQQVVFVEAKTRIDMSNLNKSKIQEMIDTLLFKMENIPLSPDFLESFMPEEDASYGIGLIALWVRNATEYSPEKLERVFQDIKVPKKQSSQNIYFVSNDKIAFTYEVHRLMKSFHKNEKYSEVRYLFPRYGKQPVADGGSISVENIVSEFAVVKAKERIQRRSQSYEDDVYFVFHSGIIEDYYDLHLVGLFIQEFQLHEAAKIYIYTAYDPENIRNFTAKFNDEFEDLNLNPEFRKINLNYDLPGFEEEL
jgi:hypothetical protein